MKSRQIVHTEAKINGTEIVVTRKKQAKNEEEQNADETPLRLVVFTRNQKVTVQIVMDHEQRKEQTQITESRIEVDTRQSPSFSTGLENITCKCLCCTYFENNNEMDEIDGVEQHTVIN